MKSVIYIGNQDFVSIRKKNCFYESGSTSDLQQFRHGRKTIRGTRTRKILPWICPWADCRSGLKIQNHFQQRKWIRKV